MANPQIQPGQSLVCGVYGKDSTGVTTLPLSSLTATVDNYAAAYVAKIQPDNNAPAYFNLVPKSVPVGQTITVNVTCQGSSQIGTPLPPVSIAVDLVGPPPPPQAAELQIVSTGPRSQFATSSVDPGNATVTLL
jgi:hypothetical protein